MPSRAEWRRVAEWALRILLVAILAVALWRSMRASRSGAVSLATRASAVGETLERATSSERVGKLNVQLDGALSPVQRAWLVALRRAGTRVSWQGASPMLAVAIDRAREPVASVRIRLLADSGGPLVLADSVGVIDTVRSANGASLEATDVVGVVSAHRGAFGAAARVPPRGDRRDVLVLGRAGWESRFVLAALGEAGWRVRGRLSVAPGVSVVDESLQPIDTARYDVVIALDSTASDLATAIARFVSQGGGLVATGSALDIGAVRALGPARAGTRRPGRILLDGDTLTRAELPLRPLVAIRGDAVVLERQPAGVAVAIRRAGRGRVAAVGYDESWRWRMQGGEAGQASHREWWSRMTGLAAPERDAAATSAPSPQADAAPRAALVAALGPPSSASESAEQPTSNRLPLLLLVVALAALLAETASRRFRGAT